MSLWFRLYTDIPNNPKVQLLPAETFRAWINILCIFKDGESKLPSLKSLAFKLRVTQGEAQNWVDELIVAGLLEREGNQILPHQWNEHQYVSDVSTERVKRFRKRQRNVSVTVPEQSRADTEQNRAHTEAAREIPASELIPLLRKPAQPMKQQLTASMRFPEWWVRYPLKTGEGICAGVWLSLVSVEAEGAVFACLDRYLASDHVSRGIVMNPNNWLHDCSRDHWKCEWPAAHQNGTSPPNGFMSKQERDSQAADEAYDRATAARKERERNAAEQRTKNVPANHR